MSKDEYISLLKDHIKEIETNGLDDKLKKKHIHEIAIFPEKNCFEIGEKVNVFDNYTKTTENGIIENLNYDGTVYVKIIYNQTNFLDLGRDYPRIFIRKK